MASPFWTDPAPLMLASTSRTRLDMLDAAGIPVETRASELDERSVDVKARAEGQGAEAIALLLAVAKAEAVSAREPGRLVLGADQTLSCGDAIFDKPADLEAARRQIAALAGRTHYLHAAGALVRDGAVVAQFVSRADLTMRPMGADFIARYVAAVGEKAMTSVGGYQMEGFGIHLFERIVGDHFTILGLPLLPLLAALREHRLLAG